MFMGEWIGLRNPPHPENSYTPQEWAAELQRLNFDPATGRAFRPGDLIEVRARAPGLFFRGKTNINEQHQKMPDANFDLLLVEPGVGVPQPVSLNLGDLKDASNEFIFDATRTVGPERYQGAAVRLDGVRVVDTQGWGPGAQLTVQDGTGRTLPLLLGRGGGFTRYPAPADLLNVAGILDQEDTTPADGNRGGYRLWVMDYDGEQGVLVDLVGPDLDGDQDVDADDLDAFDACLSGPGIPQGQAECRQADFDGDLDVDQADFGVLQRCLAGDEPADPACDR